MTTVNLLQANTSLYMSIGHQSIPAGGHWFSGSSQSVVLRFSVKFVNILNLELIVCRKSYQSLSAPYNPHYFYPRLLLYVLSLSVSLFLKSYQFLLDGLLLNEKIFCDNRWCCDDLASGFFVVERGSAVRVFIICCYRRFFIICCYRR